MPRAGRIAKQAKICFAWRFMRLSFVQGPDSGITVGDEHLAVGARQALRRGGAALAALLTGSASPARRGYRGVLPLLMRYMGERRHGAGKAYVVVLRPRRSAWPYTTTGMPPGRWPASCPGSAGPRRVSSGTVNKREQGHGFRHHRGRLGVRQISDWLRHGKYPLRPGQPESLLLGASMTAGRKDLDWGQGARARLGPQCAECQRDALGQQTQAVGAWTAAGSAARNSSRLEGAMKGHPGARMVPGGESQLRPSWERGDRVAVMGGQHGRRQTEAVARVERCHGMRHGECTVRRGQGHGPEQPGSGTWQARPGPVRARAATEGSGRRGQAAETA